MKKRGSQQRTSLTSIQITSERKITRTFRDIEKDISLTLVEQLYPLAFELFHSLERDPDTFLDFISLRFYLNSLSSYCLNSLLENGIGDTSSEELIQQLVTFQTKLGSLTFY